MKTLRKTWLPLELVGYGFFFSNEYRCNETWQARAIAPFLGEWLWLWGSPDAVLHSVLIGHNQQLCQPMLFETMARETKAVDFQRLVSGGYCNMPPPRRQLIGARLHEDLKGNHGKPHLKLNTANTGDMISFRYDGSVLGIVLVGAQAP